MQSPFRVRNWIIFLLINVLVSATTAFVVVRAFTQAANRPAVAPAESIMPQPPLGAVASSAQDADVPPADALPVAARETPIPQDVASPQPTPTPRATSRPAVQPTGAGLPNVRISTVVYPGQRTREAVVIVNEGDEVDLTGWTLSNPRGKVYTFGNVALFKESFINVHTTIGVDVQTDLFWNLTEAVWRAGDEVTLRRGDEVVATYVVK